MLLLFLIEVVWDGALAAQLQAVSQTQDPMPLDLAPSFVAAAEATLRITLPADYRVSMLRANGGCVEVDDELWWMHPIADDSDRARLRRTCNDLVRETLEARSWPGFPSDAIAFAANGSGDCLIFMPSPPSGQLESTVHRWCHETATIKAVAASFGVLVWSPG